jgi:hypothetical protein
MNNVYGGESEFVDYGGGYDGGSCSSPSGGCGCNRVGGCDGSCGGVSGGCDLGNMLDFCKILIVCLLVLYIFYKLMYTETPSDNNNHPNHHHNYYNNQESE